MKNSMRWMLVVLVMMVSVLGGGSVVLAAEGECPLQVGDGVICTGPSLPAGVEPGDTQATDAAGLNLQLGEPPTVMDADDECPIPVGDGVICTGPTVPGDGSASGQSVTIDEWVYLPVVGS